jgi:hypothetical protein
VYAGAISAIMNGQRPGLEVSKSLARFFGASTERVLRMAGHLPPADDGVDPRLQDTANRLIEVWEILMKLDPEAADNLLRIAIMQAEMVKAAAQANQKRREAEEVNNESTS